VLLAGLAIVAAPAWAAEPLPVYAGSLDFPAIESAAAPEEYSWQVALAPGETLVQLNETEAEITRLTPYLVEEVIRVPHAYDLHGTPVPTSLTVTGDVFTLTVHHREASYVYPVTTITPEERDTAPLRDLDEGGMGFPTIQGPESPERYPFRVSLGEEQFLRQVSPTEVQVFNAGYSSAGTIEAVKASAADGAKVPTTLEQTGRDVVTLVVHHRAGNPAAGGAPFDYPIIQGEGWEGGFFTGIVQMSNPNGEPAGSLTDEPSPSTSAARCTVPRLRGLKLRAAKARLRGAHCEIGKVLLATGATAGKGKVVKQFRAAGTELAAGAPVAVKLGAGASR
jgi:hypothetical protein